METNHYRVEQSHEAFVPVLIETLSREGWVVLHIRRRHDDAERRAHPLGMYALLSSVRKQEEGLP